MNNLRKMYFEEEDILHLAITDEPDSQSVGFSPNITAELNSARELNGVEIINASTFV